MASISTKSSILLHIGLKLQGMEKAGTQKMQTYLILAPVILLLAAFAWSRFLFSTSWTSSFEMRWTPVLPVWNVDQASWRLVPVEILFERSLMTKLLWRNCHHQTENKAHRGFSSTCPKWAQHLESHTWGRQRGGEKTITTNSDCYWDLRIWMCSYNPTKMVKSKAAKAAWQDCYPQTGFDS